ncbi:MAG: hypothetical protein BGO31_12465 [Bacteroidetes bacterium 43-16]|nr:MAG: hypothetical protein BGO31_12465 [Bacteroidetes bacterium 43-16]
MYIPGKHQSIDFQLIKKQNTSLIALLFTSKNAMLPFSTAKKSKKTTQHSIFAFENQTTK